MGSNVPPMIPRRVPTAPILRGSVPQPTRGDPRCARRSAAARIPRTTRPLRASVRASRPAPRTSVDAPRRTRSARRSDPSPWKISNSSPFRSWIEAGDSSSGSNVPARMRSSCRPASAIHAATWNITSFGDQPSGVTVGSSNRSAGICANSSPVPSTPPRRRQERLPAPSGVSLARSILRSTSRGGTRRPGPGWRPRRRSARPTRRACVSTPSFTRPLLEPLDVVLVVEVGFEHPAFDAPALHAPATAVLAAHGESGLAGAQHDVGRACRVRRPLPPSRAGRAGPQQLLDPVAGHRRHRRWPPGPAPRSPRRRRPPGRVFVPTTIDGRPCSSGS